MTDKPSRGRILIIDDQVTTRYIFRHILSGAGYQVEEADTGEKGLSMALSLPDLIISDVNLPDMLGYDVCRRLRANPLTVSIPILQISAFFVSDESKVQALGGGADSYLTQPVKPAVLVAQVSALIRLRRAEALSSLSARQWQTTFDALSDGVALMGRDGLIVRVNKTILDMLELSPSDLEGRPIAEVFEVKFQSTFEDFLLAQQKQGVVELASRGRWFRARVDAVEAEHSGEAGSILLLTDTTEHKKLQESLKLSERLVANGRLAHVIAHEINNPLEAMTNLLYLAQLQQSPEQQADGYVQQAAEELNRISRITKQVLAYHRESKHPTAVDPGELIDGALAIFRTRALEQNIVFLESVRCTRSLSLHSGEIRQVFSNLISNGLDAIGENGGTFRVKCVHGSDPRNQQKGVYFLFSDSGSGIPREILPKIFEAFFTTKDLKGSGIGLWLSAEVIGKHGGTIRVRSRTSGPYRGTLFSVFLPVSAD